MHSLSVFVILAFSSGCLAKDIEGDIHAAPRLFENTINETLEELKQKLITGDPEIGLPSFSPLIVDHIPLLLDIEKVIATNGTLYDLTVVGIPEFVATHLKLAIIGTKFDFTILFPHINVKAEYDGFAKLFQFIPIFGDGIVGTTIENLEMNGSVKIQLLPKITLSDMEIVFSLDSVKFALTGFMDDDKFTQLICDALDEVVGPLLNDKKTEISAIISPILMDLINGLLEGKEPEQ